MAFCGVKPSCGFNRKGARVRACAKHKRLKTTAGGGKLKTADPLRPYHDQTKYYKKYRTLAWIKKKAEGGSKAAKVQLAKRAKADKVKVSPKVKPTKLAKKKAAAPVKAPVKKVAAPKKTVKKIPPQLSPSAAYIEVEKADIKAAKALARPDSKVLKAARDKRYRESLKRKAAEAGDVQFSRFGTGAVETEEEEEPESEAVVDGPA